MEKRVVITGCGCVSPFGYGKTILWNSLLEGRNGIKRLSEFDTTGEIANIAGSMPAVDDNYVKPFYRYKLPESDNEKRYLYAVNEALEDAKLNDFIVHDSSKFLLGIADRKPNLIQYLNYFSPFIKKASKREEEFDMEFYNILKSQNIRNNLYEDSISHYVARRLHFKGQQLSISTACASGNNAIGEAFNKIKHGRVDIALVGGAYNFDLNSLLGFSRLGALTQNSNPNEACRPFDKARNGFVMGSGCGILVIEEYQHAIERGAKIQAEITGYSSLCDAYRATDSDPNAECATKVILDCMKQGKVSANNIHYVNAHGTSTIMNDLMETRAIKNAFERKAYDIPISSTKSMIGHSIMAAAAIEAIVCIMSLRDGYIHMTRNCCVTDNEMDLDYVKDSKRKVDLEYVLSNSFGFGGQNTAILLKKVM